MKIIITAIILGLFSMSYANASYYENGKLVELENIHSSRSVNGSYIEYYKNANGQKVGITDDILVQCNEGVDCPSVLNQFNLTDYKKLTDKIFVVKIQDYDNIFSVSRALFESKKVKFAHPNFIKERQRR